MATAISRVRPHFEAFLAGLRGYRKNSYPRDPELVGAVQRHWPSFLAR